MYLKKLSLFLNLFKEYLFPKYTLNTSKSQGCFLCILSGQYLPKLTHDKKRLLSAKKLIGQLVKNNHQIKIIFCAYKEIKKEAHLLMEKLFAKNFTWEVIANKSFKITNTKSQILNLRNRFKKNKKAQIIIISCYCHLPRIKRYLKFYKLNNWQVYTDKLELNPIQIFKEFFKIVKYSYQGDLQI